MAGNNSKNYNIPTLMQEFFRLEAVNLPGLPYLGAKGSQIKDGANSQYTGTNILPQPVEVNRSVYGIPIYEQITLSGEDNNGNAIEYTFPGWPLIEINYSKRIVTTEVTDNPGTVKEFIGESDREITIRGFHINHNANDIPLDEVKDMNSIAEIKKPLKVTSELLNALNIHYLVIKNLRFPEVEANITMQPFIIDALSDYPFELVIQDAASSQVLTPQQKARQLLLNN